MTEDFAGLHCTGDPPPIAARTRCVTERLRPSRASRVFSARERETRSDGASSVRYELSDGLGFHPIPMLLGFFIFPFFFFLIEPSDAK